MESKRIKLFNAHIRYVTEADSGHGRQYFILIKYRNPVAPYDTKIHPILFRSYSKMETDRQQLNALVYAVNQKAGYFTMVNADRECGLLWFQRYFKEEVQRPKIPTVKLTQKVGWIYSDILKKHVFMDIDNIMWCPSEGYVTVGQTGIMLSDEFRAKWIKNVNQRECLPVQPLPSKDKKINVLNGDMLLDAVGELRNIS